MLWSRERAWWREESADREAEGDLGETQKKIRGRMPLARSGPTTGRPSLFPQLALAAAAHFSRYPNDQILARRCRQAEYGGSADRGACGWGTGEYAIVLSMCAVYGLVDVFICTQRYSAVLALARMVLAPSVSVYTFKLVLSRADNAASRYRSPNCNIFFFCAAFRDPHSEQRTTRARFFRKAPSPWLPRAYFLHGYGSRRY